jgi:hypothetical protein
VPAFPITISPVGLIYPPSGRLGGNHSRRLADCEVAALITNPFLAGSVRVILTELEAIIVPPVPDKRRRAVLPVEEKYESPLA